GPSVVGVAGDAAGGVCAAVPTRATPSAATLVGGAAATRTVVEGTRPPALFAAAKRGAGLPATAQGIGDAGSRPLRAAPGRRSAGTISALWLARLSPAVAGGAAAAAEVGAGAAAPVSAAGAAAPRASRGAAAVATAGATATRPSGAATPGRTSQSGASQGTLA